MLRLSAILRAQWHSKLGRYIVDYINGVEYGISQGPLRSPTVFNYYHPGLLAAWSSITNNAIVPEFEITTTTAVAANTKTVPGGSPPIMAATCFTSKMAWAIFTIGYM